jgi:hypothetical protein
MGWLTADTAVTHLNDASKTLMPDEVQKVVPIDRLKMAVAGNGNYMALRHWIEEVASGDTADVAEVDAAKAWAAVPEMYRGIPTEIIYLGWSTILRRVIGYHFDGATGVTQEFTGHALRPAPVWDDPDLDLALKLWHPAERGHGVEALHLEIAKAQHRAHRAGHYGADAMKIGGGLWQAEVSRHGVELRHVGRLA